MNRTIISAQALRLFQERGYENVTVRDICDACEITKPTFYRYVPSKEELVLEVYDDITIRLSQRLLAVAGSGNYWEQLVTCFDTLYQESSKLGAGLFSQAMIANLQEDRHTFDMRPYLTEVAVDIIRHAQEAGQVRNPAPAERLYEAASHMFSGYELLWSSRDARADYPDEPTSEYEERLGAQGACVYALAATPGELPERIEQTAELSLTEYLPHDLEELEGLTYAPHGMQATVVNLRNRASRAASRGTRR